jgi:enamine deaminase RidA (YjgF/YER057c/UK114 family)
MMISPEERLAALGFSLPPAPAPSASYVPFREAGSMLYLSGQGPKLPNGTYRIWQLRTADDIPDGYADARLAGLNLLASVKAAVGELKRIEAVVKVFGMVNAVPDFPHHPKVIDGVSDLLIEVFGPEVGRHARSAVGMGSLPRGMSVEIELILKIRD